MAFTKTFGPSTGTGVYSLATNWEAVDVSNPNYSWTASGSGTNEYYLRTAANGDPGFAAQPANVYINGSNATEGTAGSLTAGQWDYADNDTLGYSTIYVRLSAAPQDPDDRDPFYVKFFQIPQTGEHVRFAATSGSITSATGLDQSAVAIGDFIIDEGYAGTIGSATIGYLYIDPNRFEVSGTGEYWIDIRAAAIPVQVYGTGNPDDGSRGLYLRGSAISVLNVLGGHVGVAVRNGETSTVTTARVLGGSCWFGSGTALTTLNHYSGDTVLRCAAATIVSYSGTLETQEAGTVTTATLWDGTFVANSTGTITTFHLYGGTLDEMQSGAARTISTTNLYPGSAQWKLNNEAVTHTTITRNGSLVLNIST